MEQTNISSSDKAGWMDEAAVEHDYSENGTINFTLLDKISIFHLVIRSMIIVVGLVGNVLTIIVLTKPRNRNSSTAVLYICLAVSDLVIILTFQLPTWIKEVFNFNLWEQICNVMLFVGYTFWENSSWAVVIITLERVVSVILPFRAKYICRPRNALLVSMSVLTLLLCSNVITMLGHDGQCVIVSDVYGQFIAKYLNYKSILMVGFVPAIIIVCGNIVICCKLRGQSFARDNSREGALAVTRTLVLVTAVFLITQLPLLIYLCLLQLGLVSPTQEIQLTLTHLCDINSSTNFILYMLQGSRFRTEVRRMFVCQ